MKNVMKKILEYFDMLDAEYSTEICRFEIESGRYLWY